MQIFHLFVGWLSLLSIDYASAIVETSDAPRRMTDCYGVYKKRTNTRMTAGGSIVSVCDNYYHWFESHRLNINRKASQQTINYVTNLCKNVRTEIQQFRVRRKKRQAEPARAKPRPKPRPKPKLRVRKEIRRMTQREWRLYVAAVNSAKKNTTISPNKYEALCDFHTGITSVSAHGGCNFHGWHRMYLLMFENALREEGPRFRHVTIPYWDSRLDSRMRDPSQSVIFTDRFYGSCQGEAKGGIMKDGWNSTTGAVLRNCGTDGPMMNDEMVYNVTTKYKLGEICGEDSAIDNDLEFHHNGMHRYIDGQMAMLMTAPHDPLFWAHHCFIDLIWEMFRKNQVKHGVNPEEDYPVNPVTMGAHELHVRDADMGFADMKVIDGLSNIYTEEWYEYEPPPTCTVKKRSCGSKYLKCVIDRPAGPAFPPRARCVSRTLAEVIEWEEEQNKPTPPPGCKNNTTPIIIKPKPGKPPPIQVVKPVQNTFCMNGKSDSGQWVYMAVKIIFRRPPDFKTYASYPVERGKVNKQNGDIYAPSAYSNVYRYLATRDEPAKYDGCLEPDEPTNTIFVKSTGLNYEGVYKEYAIVDRRLAVTVSTAYVAVRKPLGPNDESVAMLHAQDRCGRVCRPICKIPNTDIFRPCSGVVRLTGTLPLMYGNSFGDAVLDVWDFKTDTNCPQVSDNNMIVSFYCDYKTDWIWPTTEPVKRPPPTPPPSVDQTTVTSGCSLGYGCVIGKQCNDISPCTHGAKLPCFKSCHKFARCFNGQFYIHQCRRGERYDPSSRTGCSRGFCDYAKSGVRRRPDGRARGKRRRGNWNRG